MEQTENKINKTVQFFFSISLFFLILIFFFFTEKELKESKSSFVLFSHFLILFQGIISLIPENDVSIDYIILSMSHVRINTITMSVRYVSLGFFTLSKRDVSIDSITVGEFM